jgi:hypothetical protein
MFFLSFHVLEENVENWYSFFLRTKECSGIFQSGSFSPPPAKSTKEFSSDTHCVDLIELLVVKVIKV